MKQKHQIKVNLTDGNGDLDMNLYNTSNAIIDSSLRTGDVEELTVILEASQTVYISLFVVGGELERNYELRIIPTTQSR